MPARGKPGKPRAGFPPFPPFLEARKSGGLPHSHSLDDCTYIRKNQEGRPYGRPKPSPQQGGPKQTSEMGQNHLPNATPHGRRCSECRCNLELPILTQISYSLAPGVPPVPREISAREQARPFAPPRQLVHRGQDAVLDATWATCARPAAYEQYLPKGSCLSQYAMVSPMCLKISAAIVAPRGEVLALR